MEEQNKIKQTPEPSKNKAVQTYAEDMAEVIADGSGGLIKNIIHEEEDREKEKELISPESTRNKLFAAFGSLLILASVGLVGFFFMNQLPSRVEVETPFTSMIFNDATGFIEVASLSKDQIIQSVRKEVETKEVKLGGVDGIYLTLNNNIIGLRKFNELMKGSLNVELNTFVDDNFLLGFVNGVDGRDAFMLIKMRSFTDIFEDMKDWENKMFSDMHDLFGIPLSSSTAPLLTKNFENSIVQNKNARVLYQTDAEGKNTIAMMYVFVDDTHLVITRNESTVREIITRLLGTNIRE